MPYKEPGMNVLANKNRRMRDRQGWRAYRRKNYAENRMKLFEALGGARCVKCGFSDVRALQFDHINGGGRKDIIGGPGHRHTYSYYSHHPEEAKAKYQVLCANCNWIKKAEHNEKYIPPQ